MTGEENYPTLFGQRIVSFEPVKEGTPPPIEPPRQQGPAQQPPRPVEQPRPQQQVTTSNGQPIYLVQRAVAERAIQHEGPDTIAQFHKDNSPVFERAAEDALIRANLPEGRPITAPIAEPMIGLSKYLGNVTGINAALGSGNPALQFLGGAGSTITGIPGFIGGGVVGAEALFRMPPISRNLVLGMSGKHFVEDTAAFATSNPAGFAGSVAGALALGKIGSVTGRASGLVRSRGSSYIPIEKIGYEPKLGFPVSKSITEASLMRSFKEGTFYPKPSRMSLSDTVPYVPKNARLPTTTAGSRVMWTAWEKTPGIKGGKVVLGKGSSEIPGMYGAPGAEAYFAKVGGQMPEVMGFDLKLFKSPSIISTSVKGMKAVPRGIRAGGYPKIIDYSRTTPGGEAILPLMKMEYEAVMPEGTVLSMEKSGYYTKVGGIGKNRLFGTRIPILEAKPTGERVPAGADLPASFRRISGSSYSRSPVINLSTLPLTNISRISRNLTSLKNVSSPRAMPSSRIPGESRITGKSSQGFSQPYNPMSYSPPTYKPPVTVVSVIQTPKIPPMPSLKGSGGSEKIPDWMTAAGAEWENPVPTLAALFGKGTSKKKKRVKK